MFWSRDETFFESKIELSILRLKIQKFLKIKNRSHDDIELYLSAFDYFRKYPDKFDGATIVKDLVDIGELDLDAMAHDYEYLMGANRSFVKKWKADYRYIQNMEKNGKGIRVFRLFLLTVIGILFVPYCWIKYQIKRRKKSSDI